MLKLYNTLSRRKENFVPLKEGEVGIYSCGPTVYDLAHVGNLSSFIFVDLLRRWLEYRGFKVRHVMNITDVEDKIISKCSKTMPGLFKHTVKFSNLLFNDLKRLNVKSAEFYPKATGHIREMIELVKKLIANGSAYEKNGSVYFRISSFSSYGQFARLKPKSIKNGARVDSDEYGKDEARDFVLWKGWKPDDGGVFWDTEIGRGRPGWHIECSAMSMKYLGETIDIHTGGIDLIFPHHQNEIAQSEAATGRQFVRYWLHREFLNIGGGKMSKSAGSGASLSALAPEPLDAAAFRYLVVSSHYRSPLNLTDESMDAARNAVTRLRNLYSRLAGINTAGDETVSESIGIARRKFGEAMDDDLGAPKALASLFEFLGKVEKIMQDGVFSKTSAESVRDFMREVDSILGVITENQEERALGEEELALIQEREEARRSKNWKRADDIRKLLMDKGIQLEDTPRGTRHVFV